MPAYGTNDTATLLYENKQVYAFNNETVAVGELSVAFQLRRERGAFYPNGISVEVAFSGAPGTFEVDVMTADTDQASHYVSTAKINAVNSYNVGRVELPNIYAKYVAIQNTTAPNAGSITMTALITR